MIYNYLYCLHCLCYFIELYWIMLCWIVLWYVVFIWCFIKLFCYVLCCLLNLLWFVWLSLLLWFKFHVVVLIVSYYMLRSVVCLFIYNYIFVVICCDCCVLLRGNVNWCIVTCL